MMHSFADAVLCSHVKFIPDVQSQSTSHWQKGLSPSDEWHEPEAQSESSSHTLFSFFEPLAPGSRSHFVVSVGAVVDAAVGLLVGPIVVGRIVVKQLQFSPYEMHVTIWAVRCAVGAFATHVVHPHVVCARTQTWAGGAAHATSANAMSESCHGHVRAGDRDLVGGRPRAPNRSVPPLR